MPVEDFSSDYFEARRKFRAAAEGARAALEVYTADSTGPKGERLTTDVAGLQLKPAKKLLVLQSGTHGVEGYCGSACQIDLLRGGIAEKLPPGVGCMMIHAINPHGFAFDRRVTDGNIDLNRNFVDFALAPPHNADYQNLAHAIAPPDLSPETLARSDAEFGAFATARGGGALQSAITRGQYQYPDGLYYGGRAPSWSRLTFEGILQRLPPGAEKVVFVDFHTGLGPEAYGELITEDPPSAAAYRRSREWWGTSVKSTVAGESVSAQLVGTIDQAIAWALRDREVTAVALEFGTIPPQQVFTALRADNWLHTHGDPAAPEAASIKAAIRRAFYLETDDWKARVLARAREVVDQALAGLSS